MGKQPDSFKVALDDTLLQISEMLVRRDAIQGELDQVNGRIEDLEDAAYSLGTLCGIDPIKEHPELFPESAEPETGFTDAVRRVFQNIPEGRRLYSARNVRDSLKEAGFPLENYKNPLASIHTILKRLVKKGEIDRVVTEDEIRYDAKQPGPPKPGPVEKKQLERRALQIAREAFKNAKK